MVVVGVRVFSGGLVRELGLLLLWGVWDCLLAFT